MQRVKKTIQNLLWYCFKLKLVRGMSSFELQKVLDLKYGHSLSRITGRPVDANGRPIPWFTYPAIEFISQFSLSEKTIFEWGSGNSSLFFQKRAEKITSIEVDLAWYEYLSPSIDDNNLLLHVKEEHFVDTIDNFKERYDIIIIDSIYRFQCCEKAIKYLKADGVIIFDNSDWHPKSCDFLRKNGFLQIDMHGFGPINNYTWTTSIFFSTCSNFPTLIGRQPMYSLASLNQITDGEHV